MAIAAPSPVSAPLPQANQVPQPNVGDTGRGINGVPIPANPADPSQVAYANAQRTGLPSALPQPEAVAQNYLAGMPDFNASMGQYVDQFKASQAAQQQAINAGLLQAITGLGQRRDSAAGLVAALPGQYNTIQKGADQAAALSSSLGQTKGAPTSADAKAVLGANEQLINNANAQIGIAGKEAAPLLQAGVAADYSKGRTALDNTHMMNQAAIAQQQAAFDQQMAMSKAAATQDWAKMQAGYQHDTEQAALQSALGTKNQEDFLLWEQNHGLTPKNLNPNQQALDQGAIKNGFQNYGEYQTAKANGDYSRAVNSLAGKTKWWVDAKTQIDASKPDGKVQLAHYLASANPQVYKALVADGFFGGPMTDFGAPAKG